MVIDINGNSFNGYKSCYYRTFICGSATQEQKDGYEVARKMMYDGLAQMRAGSTTDDVLDACPAARASGAMTPTTPATWGATPWPTALACLSTSTPCSAWADPPAAGRPA